MDKLTKNAGVIVTAAVLSVCSAWMLGIGQDVVGPSGPPGQPGKDGNLGALSSPDISSPYISWGGVRSYRTRLDITGATNTPCIITSPAATSTLNPYNFGMRIATGSSTASVWFASKGTSLTQATTVANRINHWSLASAAQGTFVGTTTNVITTGAGVVDNALVFAPNQLLVFTGAGYVPSDATKFVGSCYAEFTEVY